MRIVKRNEIKRTAGRQTFIPVRRNNRFIGFISRKHFALKFPHDILSAGEKRFERVFISPGGQLNEINLSVIKPDGTEHPVVNSTLNAVMQKEVIAP
jgi:hypothetical protein